MGVLVCRKTREALARRRTASASGRYAESGGSVEPRSFLFSCENLACTTTKLPPCSPAVRITQRAASSTHARGRKSRSCVAANIECGGGNLYQKTERCTCDVDMRVCAPLVADDWRDVSPLLEPRVDHLPTSAMAGLLPAERLLAGVKSKGYGQCVMGS